MDVGPWAVLSCLPIRGRVLVLGLGPCYYVCPSGGGYLYWALGRVIMFAQLRAGPPDDNAWVGRLYHK
jgi:hypothetical protein